MRSTALFFAAASAMSGVAYAGLAGLTFNAPSTAASREDRFDIVTINPTTGQATTTQKQLYALFDGAIDFTNTVVGPNQWALSLQAFDQAQVLGQTSTTPLANAQTTNPVNPASSWGYLARQDLRAGGRFEYCQLTASNQPINIFWDSDSSVIATAVTPASASFNLVRISFSQSSTFCVYSQIAILPAISSISANVKAQRGNRIYFVTEPASTFSQLAAVTIRSYDIASTGATAVHATTLATGIFPTAIAPTSDNIIIFQGWNSAISSTTAGFVTYEINLATFASTTTLTTRGITSANEEISFASTFVNQTNSLYTLKNVATTITTTSTVSTVTATNPAILFSQPWLAATSFAATSTSETKATTALNTFNVFNVFDLANATIAALDTDASTTTNTLVLTGAFAYAGVLTGVGAINRASVSTCKITFTNTGATAATTYETVANGAGNSASCSLSTIPTAATAVQVQFAADGVNYGPASSFTYNGVVSTGRFGRSTYNLRDGTPVEAAGEKVTVELLDSNGRKILFPASSTTVTLTAAATGAAVIRSITGNVADARNGRAIFPNLAIDVDYPSANNNGDIAILTLSASYSASTNTVVATSTVNVRLIRSTRGTLAALAFPTVAAASSQVFETHLINPGAALTSAALKIGTRTLQDTTIASTNNLAPAIALGLVAYDKDNKVLNTVETRATDSNNLNTLVLNGAALSGSGTRGVGVCVLPRSTNSNDGPSSIWYESTDATSLATTFLAIVQNTDLTTGSGARLVRYTRLAGSTVSQTCTAQQVDLLPIFDHGYGNHQVLPLTDGRIAFVENDSFFTATSNNVISNTAYGGSILSVFRYSTVAATAGATATVAGVWTIRNKVLPMNGVASVTQSATNELAIAGNVWGSVNSNGVYLVDISTEATANTAATAATASLFTTSSINNDFAVFLAAGTADTFADNRNRYQGSSTVYTATTSQSYIESIQLARGLTVPSAARSVEATGRNYIDFFNIDDVVITALSPNSIAKGSTQAITVTANNVINSSQLKCRFSSGNLNAVEYSVSATLTTTTLAADGTTVNCGAVPTNFAALDGYTYIQVSNDGGANYGPEGKLAVGTAAPVVSNVAVPTASSAVSSNTVFYEVYGDFTDNTANRATLSTFFGVTLLNQLNALNLGTWFLSQAFTVGTTTTTSGRSNYNVVYQTIATSSRLAVLQSSSAQLNALLGLISSSSNQAVLSGAGATTNARVYNGSSTSTSSSSTLSQGAIAGIVIGCVVGGLLIIAGIAYLLFKSSQNKKAATFSQSRTYDARGGSSSSGSSSSSSSSDDGSYSDYSSDDYSDYV